MEHKHIYNNNEITDNRIDKWLVIGLAWHETKLETN